MTYQIVVGVDGSDASERALRWAASEAQARGGTVQAITAWHWDGSGTFFVAATSPTDERDRARQILDQAVDKVTVEFTDAVIARELVDDGPARALTHAASGADILVLGSHGHNRLHHAVLGSVSEECVRRATCPVVVLPVPHRQAVQIPAAVAVAH
jgi:nucleotide-binding universal stress UspA family protein